MEEPTPTSSNDRLRSNRLRKDRLRMALRLRLSLRRAGNGRQSGTVFIPNPTREPVLGAHGTENSTG